MSGPLPQLRRLLYDLAMMVSEGDPVISKDCYFVPCEEDRDAISDLLFEAESLAQWGKRGLAFKERAEVKGSPEYAAAKEAGLNLIDLDTGGAHLSPPGQKKALVFKALVDYFISPGEGGK